MAVGVYMFKKLLIPTLFIFLLTSCSYTWYSGNTKRFPTTAVDNFRVKNGFCFPEGTKAYDIMTCLGLGPGDNRTLDYSKVSSNIYPYIKFTSLIEGDTKNCCITIYNNTDSYSYSFTFNKYEGITDLDYTDREFTILVTN